MCVVSVGGGLSHEVRLRLCSKEDEKEEEREGEKKGKREADFDPSFRGAAESLW